MPDIETCGLRHCQDADYQMHLKYPRQPIDNFLQKCKSSYEDWKATVGYAHDCLDVNSTSLKETKEPFPGFNNLKNAYEERLKKINEHKMERLSIFAKHAADDGAHHHSLLKPMQMKLQRRRSDKYTSIKSGKQKLGASKCRIGFNIIRKAKI